MAGDTLGTAWAIDWVRRSAAVIDERRVELITLDREIGDGDHGENMDRGFSAVRASSSGARRFSTKRPWSMSWLRLPTH